MRHRERDRERAAAPGRSRIARSGAKRSFATNTMIAPEAIPSIATDTARNDR